MTKPEQSLMESQYGDLTPDDRVEACQTEGFLSWPKIFSHERFCFGSTQVRSCVSFHKGKMSTKGIASAHSMSDEIWI